MPPTAASTHAPPEGIRATAASPATPPAPEEREKLDPAVVARRRRFAEQMDRLVEGVASRGNGPSAAADVADAARRFDDEVANYARLSQYEFKLSPASETQFAKLLAAIQKTALHAYTRDRRHPDRLGAFADRAYEEIRQGGSVGHEARQQLKRLTEERPVTNSAFTFVTEGEPPRASRTPRHPLLTPNPCDAFAVKLLFLDLAGSDVLDLADFVLTLAREVESHRQRDRRFFRMVSLLPDGVKGRWLESEFWAKGDREEYSEAQKTTQREVKETLLALPREAGWEQRLDKARADARARLVQVERRKWSAIQLTLDKLDREAFDTLAELNGFRDEIQGFLAANVPGLKLRLKPLVPLGPDGKPRWDAPAPLPLADDPDDGARFAHLVKVSDGVYEVQFTTSPKPPGHEDEAPKPGPAKPNPFIK